MKDRATGTSPPRHVWIALVAYAVVTLWLTLHHEAWCNEADTWLLMRDGGVRLMLANTAHAGTPALWYLCLAPFASAGFPYLAQQLLNLAIIWCAMLLFVIAAPFRPLLKILFLFSLFIAYEYAAQARPYALLIALLFGIAMMWRDRAAKPVGIAILVALLANTTVHGLLFGAIVGLLFVVEAIVERRLRVPSTLVAIAVMLAGGIASVIQLWPHSGGQRIQFQRYVDPGTIPYAMGMAFFPGADPRFSFVPGLIILLLAVLAIGNRTVPLLFVSLSVVTLLLLFTFVWMGGRYHAGLILIVLIAGLWMARPDRVVPMRMLEVALGIGLAWSVYAAVQEGVAETRWAHSGSREMATYLERHVSPSTIVAAYPPVQTESVLAYLPGRRFWYISRGAFGSYMLWGKEFDREHALPTDTAVEQAKRRLAGNAWLLLVNGELPPGQASGMRLVFRTRQTVYARRSEQYWLYAPAGSERGHLPSE